MASIDDLKTLINHKISNTSKFKMSVYVNSKQPKETNCICLFYNTANQFVSLTKAPYYQNGIQVSVRHNNCDKSRTIAYDTLEYINVRRKTLTGVYFIPENTPIYRGVDEQTGGYWFSFDVFIKGAK